MIRYLLLCLMVLLPIAGRGQCFSSAGNPVGGSGNTGTLDKGTLSVVGYYKYALSDRYFEGSQLSEVDIIRNANYNYLGTLLAYGVTNTVTLETELGYFINKTKNYRIPEGYSLKGFGLSNAAISAKYQIYYNPEKKIEFSAAAGIKFPFSPNSKEVDHVRLPFDLQPSTSALGMIMQAYLIKQHSLSGMRYFLYNRMEVNGVNKDGYRYGNTLTNSIFISRHLIRTSNWPVSGTVIMQVRNEIRGRSYINKVAEPSSGSVKVYVSPQLNLAFVEKWNLSFLVDIPVYQYYTNLQLADKVGFAIILVKPVEL